KQAEEALRESERFARSVVDALSAHIAILDETGQIIAVNKGWRLFASSNNAVLISVMEEANYLQVCETAVGAGAEEAAAFAAGIRAVIQGKQEAFSLEYACHSPSEKRWFVGRVTRFPGEGRIRIVVAHENITERKRAEQTIQASEERFRALIQNSSDIISVFDVDGVASFHSPAIESVMGYTPKLIIGRNVFGVIHPDDIASMRTSFESLISRQLDTISVEVRLLHTDQSWRTLEAVMTNQLDNPVINGIVVNSRDITERKKSENELTALYNASSYLFKSDSLLNLAHQIVKAVVTEFGQADCRLILINKDQGQLEELAHSQKHHIKVQKIQSLDRVGILQDSVRTGKAIYIPDISLSLYAGSASSGIHSQLVIPLRSMNGLMGLLDLRSTEVHAFDNINQRILSAFGERAGFAVEAIKLYEKINHHAGQLEVRVTERTAQLQRSKDRLEAILNHSSDAIIMTEPDGVIRQTNQTFSKQFNYPIEEEFGQLLSILVNGEQSKTVLDTLKNAVQEKTSQRLDMVVYRQDGTFFDADIAISPIIDTNGITTDVVCSIRDISLHKQFEESLRVALVKEKELNVMKTNFISMVSHDFRTPLAVIMASAETLEAYYDRLDAVKKARHYANIHTQINRMVALLDDVLTINRADAGAILFKPILIDLNQFCQDMAQEFQSMPYMKHRLLYSCSSPPVKVLIDEKLLQQALINLLTNAFKYSPEGSVVEFDLSFDQEHTIIRIKDSGIGIPESDLPRMFETFRRATNVGQIEGTGLGLAIVKRSVEAHGGTIAIESHIGTGTTFTISLPLLEVELSPA
ncbi:MAG: PAS domain S-box protein, partial [Anaerolineae bacterium]|nr:PAS domain S-box protein [Anaerolineae bacterium]